MATESLVPDGVVSADHDWINQASATATAASVDEGITGDADTTYVEQPSNTPSVSDTMQFTLGNPVGDVNLLSGADSWTLRVRAKYVGLGEPDSFEYALYEGASLRAGPFSPTLTSSYQQFDHTFDPASITSASNLLVQCTSQAGVSGDKGRITAIDLLIQLVPVVESRTRRGGADYVRRYP